MYLRAIIAALLVAVAAPLASAQTVMTQTQFRDHVIAKAKATDGTFAPKITGPLSFNFGDGARVNLDTGYAEYTADPSQLDNITRRWLQGLTMLADKTGPSASDLKTHLVQLVRSRDYISNASADLPTEKMPVWRPLGSDLVVLLMADYPTMRGSVTGAMLTEAGIKPDDAWKIAKANVFSAMGALQVGSFGPEGPVAITAESGLATALLADPDACAAKGSLADAYVFVVDRDTFLIGRTSDPNSIQPFWTFVRGAAKTDHYASSTPLACKDGALADAAIPASP